MEGETVIWVKDVACWCFVAELHLELVGESGEDLILTLCDLLNHVAILIDVLNLNDRVRDVRVNLVCELFSKVENLAFQDLGLVNLCFGSFFFASEFKRLGLHHLSL